ncbi:YqxA family protein [Microbacteriaceae bacterium 4G12]
MKRFMMRCLLISIALFISTLFGMQLANDGLKRMKGYNDPTFEQVAHVTGTKRGDVEATLLGNTFTIEEKQKQLEQLKSFNAFSKLGDALTAGVEKTTRVSTDAVTSKIREIFEALKK